MVRLQHIVPASLTLSIGIAPAVAAASSLSPPLAGHARGALADNIARLHQSVRRARSIIEIRDADVPVSSSKLQQILGEIKSLEKQVSALLPDGAGVDDATAGGPRLGPSSGDANDCEVGSGGPSRRKANCSMKADAGARKPAHDSALGPWPSPAAGALLGDAKDGELSGPAFDETSGLQTPISSSPPSWAASKYGSEDGRDSDDSSGSSPDSEASAPGEKGEESHEAPSNKADEERPPSAAEEEPALPASLMKTPPGGTTSSFLTARPAKAPQQAVITQDSAATVSPGHAAMGLIDELSTTTITRTGSSRTTIKVTRTRTRTIRVDGRTSPAATKATRTPAEAKLAMPSPAPDEAGRDTDQDAGGVAPQAPDFSRASPSVNGQRPAEAPQPFFNPTPSSSEAGRDTDRAMGGVATRAPDFSRASPSINAQPLAEGLHSVSSSTPSPDEAVLDTGRAATRAPDFSRASPSIIGQRPDQSLRPFSSPIDSSPNEASQDTNQGTGRVATRAPDFSRASPSLNAQRLAGPPQPFSNPIPFPNEAGRDTDLDAGRVATRTSGFSRASPSINVQWPDGGLPSLSDSTTRLYAPPKTQSEQVRGDNMAGEAPTSRAQVQAAPPAMTTRRRSMLPLDAGGAGTSLPAPSGFKTIATRASKTRDPRT